MKKKLIFLTIIALFIFGSLFNNNNDSTNNSDSNNNNFDTFNVDSNGLNKDKSVENVNLHVDDSNSNDDNDISNSKLIPNTSCPGSYFEIHFIDVGQGDSALIMCDDHYMLIDGGGSKCSSLIYDYLKKYSIDYLDYVICSHPDEDHVGGLAGALNYASLGAAYSPYEKDTRAYSSFVKYINIHNVNIETPEEGMNFNLGSANISILAVNVGEGNDASIVVKVEYVDNSFLFMGDSGTAVEDYLLNGDYNIKCDLLKVAHHGSQYSTGHRFLYETEPKYAVISVGSNNNYGHPSDEVLSKLRDADVKTYRTDLQGDIICKSDGSNIFISTEKNSDIDTLEQVGLNSVQKIENINLINADNDYVYCLNKKTKKFHYTWCSSVNDMKDSNKIFSNDSREEIISNGYVPCKRCNP